MGNKQEKSVIAARRNQQCHNVSGNGVLIKTRNLKHKIMFEAALHTCVLANT